MPILGGGNLGYSVDMFAKILSDVVGAHIPINLKNVTICEMNKQSLDYFCQLWTIINSSLSE